MRSHLAFSILVFGIFFSDSQALSAAPLKQKDPIQAAIKKGADYLIAVHRPAPNYNGGSNAMGTACLAGLALLESGVSEKNPSLQNIVNYVRAGCLKENGTYQVSLCIMFLDQLGHPADRVFIQFLGYRLMSGQTAGGGWSYQSDGYALNPQAETYLRNSFLTEYRLTSKPAPVKDRPPVVKDQPRPDIEIKTNDPPPKKEPPKKVTPKAELPALAPSVKRLINEMGRNPKNPGALQPAFNGRAGMDGDNSNTQFATLGLWCARKHGVPVENAMRALDTRFRQNQGGDGGWCYSGGVGSTPTMTCAGLIALAVTYGATESVLKSGSNVKAPAKKDNRPDLGDDNAVKAGLNYLGACIQGGPPNGKMPMRAFNNFLTGNLYFLWSLERVGVIYGLTTIGKQDWYEFGADALVNSQMADGSWNAIGYPGASPEISTPFALLFLNRANVARDLSASLKGKVHDPGISTLRGGDLTKFLPDPHSDPSKTTPGDTIDPMPIGEAPIVNPMAPVAKPDDDFDAQAAKLTTGLIHASGQQRTEMIAMLRDTKGSVYTKASPRSNSNKG